MKPEGLLHCLLCMLVWGQRFFSETFYSLITQGPDQTDVSIDDVTDADVKKEIQLAIDSENIHTLTVIIEGTYIRVTGWEIISDFDKKHLMIKGK